MAYYIEYEKIIGVIYYLLCKELGNRIEYIQVENYNELQIKLNNPSTRCTLILGYSGDSSLQYYPYNGNSSAVKYDCVNLGMQITIDWLEADFLGYTTWSNISKFPKSKKEKSPLSLSTIFRLTDEFLYGEFGSSIQKQFGIL